MSYWRIVYFTAWYFIVVVSAIDGYLVFRHRYEMLDFEKNPLGLWLIQLNEGNVWYFLVAKLVGTIVVCGTLLTVSHFNKRLGFTLTITVAIIQLGVVLILALW